MDAQEIPAQFRGDWIVYKKEMKDGSRLFDRYVREDSFLAYRFGPKSLNIGTIVSNFGGSGLPATYKNGNIATSAVSGYDIMSISQDTIVLTESFQNSSDDKMKRYHLVSKARLFSEHKIQNTGIDTLRGSNFFSPSLKNDLSAIVKNHISGKKGLLLKGLIRLNLDTKTSTVLVESASPANTKNEQEILAVLNNCYQYWDVSEFTQYKVVDIPFEINCMNAASFYGFTLYFYPAAAKSNDPNQIKNMAQSGKLFLKAAEEFNKGNLDAAADLFDKAYKADPINIDALYNKASILLGQNKSREACADWQILANLGQRAAIDLLAANCR
ncbi:MAG TPA: hypothetical protein VF581_03795 [Flavobacterium sp.]|jgi:hypothetical protein